MHVSVRLELAFVPRSVKSFHGELGLLLQQLKMTTIEYDLDLTGGFIEVMLYAWIETLFIRDVAKIDKLNLQWAAITVHIVS